MHLIDEVRQRDSLAEIARLVSTRIDSVLHPTSLHIFYRAKERSETFEGHSVVRHIAGQRTAACRSNTRCCALIDDAKAIRDFPADFKDSCRTVSAPGWRTWACG